MNEPCKYKLPIPKYLDSRPEGAPILSPPRKGDKNASNALRDQQKVFFDVAGKKVYGCNLCDYTTKQKGMLKVHINSVHYNLKVCYRGLIWILANAESTASIVVSN